MKKPEEVLKIFEKYSYDLREDVKSFLDERKSCKEMYDMIRYFFGWLDTDLKPTEEYGGKQFRGSLCLLVAEVISGNYKEALPVASSLELYHNFTLIHDDIMDNDLLRRGRPTVWKLWGINHGINTGDALYVLGLKKIKNIGLGAEKILKISNFLEERYLEVIEGQYLDFTLEDYDLGNKKVTEDLYLLMIKKKTSVLVGAATKGGAMVACDDESVWQKFYEYGLNLGLAYQLCDDLVSIWGDENFTGKIRYNDIKQKKKTLAIIKLFNKINKEEKERLENIFAKEELNDVEAKGVVKLMDNYNIYDECWSVVAGYKEKAKAALVDLNIKLEHKEKLAEICDTLIPNIKQRVKV